MENLMEKQFWSNADIHRLFKLKTKSRQTLLNAEERGEIPTAKRVSRGNTLVRQWSLEQLPKIGERFGFLKKTKKQEILCFYTAKGGVLKTTLAYSLARILALNGVKTILIGLDIQCSITDIALPPIAVESLDDVENENFGLYHYLFEKISLKKIIKQTSLPTLFIIPETTDLNVLEKKLRLEPRREYLFKDKLISQLQEYDVVIFDNGPSWNQLIENALTTSSTIISPIGCDIGTYQALQTNLNTLFEFQTAMKLEWANFFLVPTLLEKTKLSQQIYGAYLNQYTDKIISTPIRRAVKGQEAILLRQSAIEHDPTTPLAQDYFELTQELWNRILSGRGMYGFA
jgi:chromosome partitioning protein